MQCKVININNIMFISKVTLYLFTERLLLQAICEKQQCFLSDMNNCIDSYDKEGLSKYWAARHHLFYS